MKGKGIYYVYGGSSTQHGPCGHCMAEEPGSGEPGGAQLGTMIEMRTGWRRRGRMQLLSPI